MKKSNLIIISTLAIVYCLPIIFGTSYYYDDLFRAYSGYSSWNSDGRPFANIFYQILTFGQTMPDMFPVALIISIFIFAYIGKKLGDSYGANNSYAYCFAYTMIIMSPLFISNLLFRYDSSFMMLAISACIFPYTITLDKKINIAFGTLAVIVSFGLYQAAISIFIAFAGIELFRNSCFNDAKSTIKKCAIRIMQLVVAYVIYSKLILGFFVINDYFKEFNQPISLSVEGMSQLMANISTSMHNITLMLSPGFLIAATPIICYSIFCVVNHSITRKKSSPIIGLILALVALSIAVPGIAIFGEKPIFYPRIYIGVGACIFFICYIPVMLNGNKKITIAAQFIFMLYLFGMINATINAVRSDVEFQKTTSQRIINIIDNNYLSTNHKIVILGQLRQSPLSYVNSLSYPLITILSPQHFINGYDGGRFMIMHAGLDNVEYPDTQEQNKYRDEIKKSKPIFANNIFSIYNINSTTVISFENTLYDDVNNKMNPYVFKNNMVSDAHYGDRYFYACISNVISPNLKRNEWYYLLIHNKDGSVINRNFFVPYSIHKNEKTCVSTQWKEPISLEGLKSIEFGIYNINSMQRRVDLGS